MKAPENGEGVIFIDRRGQSRRAVVVSPDRGHGLTVRYEEVGRTVDELARHVSEPGPAAGGGRWRAIGDKTRPRLFTVEIGGMIFRRPGFHRSDTMTRIWIGPFAVSAVNADLAEFATTLYRWS